MNLPLAPDMQFGLMTAMPDRATVKATVGHLRDLPQRELGVDIENGFTPKYVTIRGKGKNLAELPRSVFVVRVTLDALGHEMLEVAREKLQAELGRTVSDEDLLREALALILTSDADGSVPGRKRVDGSRFFRVGPASSVGPKAPERSDREDPVGGRVRTLSSRLALAEEENAKS